MTQPAYPGNRPLPPEIYRRRRIAAAVVAVVVLVVLVLVVRAVAGGGDPEGTASSTSVVPSTASSAADRTATTATSTATSTVTSTASSESPASSTAPAGTTTSLAAEPGGECTAEDLVLSVSAGLPTYAAGELPDFYLSVSNPTGSGCAVDLSANPMSFEVYTLSDYARVWADTDCNEPTLTGTLELAAGEERSFALNGWSRTTSSPDQCIDREPAGTGAFLLYGRLGDSTSEPATFNLA
ncbi:hypothetical protein Csp1_22360 [Corynebacterium provencense]|uniref:Uncharacterized protein n=1 Tax=Corynebacterium provencense TaxID=1737425 RepID=A0A2Z3YQF5_9CORY|nr:hypothetical protein [Corynebacterium provencense]AWT26986.1 hypothetical protein Csp1_22360 [Corynebacterium provencense]